MWELTPEQLVHPHVAGMANELQQQQQIVAMVQIPSNPQPPTHEKKVVVENRMDTVCCLLPCRIGIVQNPIQSIHHTR